MLKIYFIRHAEAMGNVLEFFQGRTDVGLSEKGEKQLEYLAERFREIPIERIYSSPLKRALLTAEAVNRYHDLPIITNNGLIEIDGGVWEGKQWKENERLYPEAYYDWKNRMWDFHVEGSETMEQVYERMKSAVTGIAEENAGRTIAVVSHGCALRNYLAYAESGDIKRLADVGWSDNTAVSLIEYDDNLTPEIIFKNESSHLPPELSTLAFSRWNKYDEKGEDKE